MLNYKQHLKSLNNAIVKAALGVVFVLCSMCFLFVFWQSFFDTCWLNNEEQTIFYSPSLLMQIVLIAFLCSGLFCAVKFIHYFKAEKFVLPVVTALIAICAIVWVIGANAAQSAEPLLCRYIADGAILNNWNSFEAGEYMSIFPFQSGFVLYLEIIYRMAGDFGGLAVSLLNVAWLVSGCGALYKLTGYISSNPKAKTCVALLFLALWPWVLYCTFNYGTLPSLAIVLWALVYFLKFLNSKTVKNLLPVLVLFSFAMAIKSTALIPLIAVCIILVLDAIAKKDFKILFIIPILCLATYSVGHFAKIQYELRSGYVLGEGTPKIVWISMGLEEGSMAKGWFNGKTYSALPSADMDVEKCIETQKADIKNRIDTFMNDKEYAKSFFWQKVNSQWLDPSFGALTVSRMDVDPQQSHIKPVAQYITTRTQNSVVFKLADAMQSIIYFFAFIGMVACLKKPSLNNALLCLVALGGFLYLLISEGKSQYAFCYFVMLIPYGAKGMCFCANVASKALKIKAK